MCHQTCMKWWEVVGSTGRLSENYLMVRLLTYFLLACACYWWTWLEFFTMHKLWRTIAPPDTFDEIGALFSWASKVIRNFICFASLCSVIGRPNSRHLLNQSQLKMKQITTWSSAFSRASERLLFLRGVVIGYLDIFLCPDWPVLQASWLCFCCPYREERRPTFQSLAQQLADALMELKNTEEYQTQYLVWWILLHLNSMCFIKIVILGNADRFEMIIVTNMKL